MRGKEKSIARTLRAEARLLKMKIKRHRKTQKQTPSVQQVFDQIEFADNAMKKLFMDESLTDEELDALLHSEYMIAVRDKSDANDAFQADTLYKQSKLGIAVSSPFLFTNIESEVLAYFGRHPELMYSLSPRKFEELIATVFRNNGFEVELTPETRDGGVDVIAVQKNGFGGSTLHLVECKRYLPENKVGIGIVQRMLGVVEQHRATQGLIITTSSFSRDAQICAQSSPYRIGLNGYVDLARWLAAFAK